MPVEGCLILMNASGDGGHDYISAVARGTGDRKRPGLLGLCACCHECEKYDRCTAKDGDEHGRMIQVCGAWAGGTSKELSPQGTQSDRGHRGNAERSRSRFRNLQRRIANSPQAGGRMRRSLLGCGFAPAFAEALDQ